MSLNVIDRPRQSADRLAARADAFTCFARAFAAPLTGDATASLATRLTLNLSDLYDELNVDADNSLRALDRSARALRYPSELLDAYSTLFLVAPVRVPLNLSTYLDFRGMLESKALMDRWYRHHGLAPSREFNGIPDHLSLALGFVGLVTAEAADAFETAGLEAAAVVLADAKTFSDNVLSPALPAIARAAHAAARERQLTPFYAHLADLLCQLLGAGRTDGATQVLSERP